MKEIIPQEIIENRIYLIRGHKVMLDKDLARLYSVPTKRLNEQVKRNLKRFPGDFMFQLTLEEALRLQFGISNSRSQFATLKQGQNIKYLPRAFTEQGVAMLSSVINSEKAIQVNIAIMRAFVKLRKILSTHKKLAQKLNELETKVAKHDTDIGLIFEAIRQLMASPPEKPRRMIGFRQE
jgi:phage regulator Rha-like protein